MDVITASQGLIYANIILDSIGWGMLIPVLPGLHAEMQLTTLTIGSITSIVSTIVFLSGAVQGKIADMIGKVTMLHLSVLSQLLGMILMYLAIKLHSVPLFILARCVPASCKCGMVVSQALLYELRSKGSDKDGVKDIGRLIAFSNIAYILGPVLGGLLYTFRPYAIFIAGIGFNVCSLCLLSLLASYTNNTTGNAVCKLNNHQTTLKQPAVLVPATTALIEDAGPTQLLRYLHIKFAFQLGNTLFEALFAQHAMTNFHLSSSATGLLLGWCGLLSALTNVFLLPFVSSTTNKQKKKKRRQSQPQSMPLLQHDDDEQQEEQEQRVILPALTAALALGLSLWAVSNGGIVAVFASSLVTIASNLFLCLLQGLIAQTQPKDNAIVAIASSSRLPSRSPSNSSLSSITVGNHDNNSNANIIVQKKKIDSIISSSSSDCRKRGRSESFSAPATITACSTIIASNSNSNSSNNNNNTDVPVSMITTAAAAAAAAIRRRLGKRRSGSEDLDANGRPRSNNNNPASNEPLSVPITAPSSAVATPNSSGSGSGSGSGSNSGMGAVMGLSSTADRAARIVSPALGSFLAAQVGSAGLVLYSCLACLYCMVLLLHGNYYCHHHNNNSCDEKEMMKDWHGNKKMFKRL